MRPLSMAVPKKGADRWLYEILRHLQLGVQSSQSGLNAIVRGEKPDGSGDPLPNPDTTDFFKLSGRPGGQVGDGGVAASENVTFSSTAHATKGFVYLGVTTGRKIAFDETSALLGINKDAPAATLHINSLANPHFVFPDTASRGFPFSWTNQAGSGTGAALLAAVVDDSDSTYDTETVLATPGGELFLDFWTGGPSPIVSGETIAITFRHRASAGQAGTERFKFILTGNPVGTIKTVTRATASSATFEDYTVTLSAAEVALLVASVNGASLDIFAVGIGAASFDIARVYFTRSTGAIVPAVRWDLAGTASGQIDVFGQMGIGTGTTSLAAMLTILPLSSSTIAEKITAAASQTADLLRLTNSAGTALSGFDASGNPYLIAHAALDAVLVSDASGVGSWKELVASDDEMLFYEDSPVYFQ